MAEFGLKVKNQSNIKDKPRVYFTCHPDDFERYFERVASDFFRTQDCAIYYTENMSEPLSEENLGLDLSRMNLFVVPVTLKLLVEDNRAMSVDIPHAMASGIPILPIMMEDGIVEIYSRPDRFGERQFISPKAKTGGEISYEKKLSDFLYSILAPDDLVLRIRAEFDARIFLSYRKSDKVWAETLLSFIHDDAKYRDVAIWYDEFLFPGESFDDNIKRSLWRCDAFALLVTPSLLQTPNYVLEEEYPMAIQLGKPIIAIEMEKTDRNELEEKYNGIPECVSGIDTDELYKALDILLDGVISTENNNSPEHNYLIGRAYLDGIDVEVNRPLGLKLITYAAENGYPEAIVTLYQIYTYLGNYEQALKWAEVIYSSIDEIAGTDSEPTLRALNNLANAYSNTRQYTRAVRMGERAYQASLRFFGESHPTTLIAINNLAIFYADAGECELALTFAKKSYTLYCKTYGEEHPETLVVMNNLAYAYYGVGEAAVTCEMLERAYKLSVKMCGTYHSDTLNSLSNLAFIYGEIGEMEKYLECTELAYRLRCEHLGTRHPDTLVSWGNLATAYFVTEQYERSLECCEQVYPAFYEVFGKYHPDTLERLCDLAMCFLAIKEVEKGVELLTQYHEGLCEVYGADSTEAIEISRLINAIVSKGE